MYSFQTRIRYSETDGDGLLSLTGIMNYFQDCACFQLERDGCGLDWLKEKDRGWVVTAWQIRIFRRPRFTETVTIVTKPYCFMGSLGYRNNEILSENGEKLAEANSIWCYVNLSELRPARLKEEDKAPYGKLDEPADWEGSRKIRTKEPGTELGVYTVCAEDLDTNHHMNNARYLSLAEHYLPEGYSVCRLDAEYRKQARLGEKIIIRLVQEDEWNVITMTAEDDTVYAAAAFSDRMQPMPRS